MKRFSLLLAMALILAVAVPAMAGPFSDVPATHWAYDALQKLSSTGIITGYPDGTFKGKKTLSRYEIAVVTARILDNVAAERAMLAEKVDALEDGLTAGQAEDVIAIFKSLMTKNAGKTEVPVAVESDHLSATQAEEVAGIVSALVMEFQFELEALNADIAALGERIDAVDARIDELNTVSFNGKYSVDFYGVNVEGNKIDAEVGSYYYADPFNAQSGWWVRDPESWTDNEFDGSEDGSYTDEEKSWTTDAEDYYTGDVQPFMNNKFDLNVAVNKDVLSADINMTAMTNKFGKADDTVAFELYDLSGTITTPDFTATIEDEQAVSFKDYLFDDSEIDGIVVEAGDNMYFLGKYADKLKNYTGIVANEEDEYDEDYRDHLFAGAKTHFNVLLPVDIFLGYEYAAEEDFFGTTEAEVKKTMVALDTNTSLLGFDLNAEVATNLFVDDAGHLFRGGISRDFGIFDVAFNYENTEDMIYIEKYAYTGDTKGYDVEVGADFAIFENSFLREDYDNEVTDTYTVEIPEGKFAPLGFNIDGLYELTLEDTDGKNEVRNVNVAKNLGGLALSYVYDYDVDNDLYDNPRDRKDDGQVTDPTEKDRDSNEHVFGAEYTLFNNITAGVEYAMEKDITEQAKEIKFADKFENTVVFTGRYAGELLEAGFEKELDGDLVVDGSVNVPTITLLGTTIDSELGYERNIDAEKQNVKVAVDVSRDIIANLALTNSFVYDVREINDWDRTTIEGTKLQNITSLEYTVSEDLSATSDFEFMKFDQYEVDKSYTVKKITGGFSYSF